MDKKDKKLLYYLTLDAKASDTQLGKKIGLSKNAVRYRIERLKKERIIKKFTTVVNFGPLSLDNFSMALKFNEDIYKNPEILDYFKNHPCVMELITLTSPWDIFIDVIYNMNPIHIHQIITGIINHFGDILNSYEVFFAIDQPLRDEPLVTDFFKELNLDKPKLSKRVYHYIESDEIDKKILHLLAEDSSRTYISIAKELGINVGVVIYKVKKLIQHNVIVKFFPEINLQKLGYTEYLCNIRLKSCSKEELELIKNKIRYSDNVTYALFNINNFSIVFNCAFRKSEDVDHLLRSLRKDHVTVMDKQECFIIKERLKLSMFPTADIKSVFYE